MKHLASQNNTVRFLALAVSVGLILSLVMPIDAYGENVKKVKDSKSAKKIAKQPAKKVETKNPVTNKSAQTQQAVQSSSQAQADPLQEKLKACKQKETQREQYECEKALKSGNAVEEFKTKSTKTVIGPITFYYAGATVEKSGGTDIVNLKFLAENTGSKDNISLYCTGPAVCNYDVSDGTTTYKYASNDFTNGQIVLKPGASRIFNILFGPAIGYGSYVDFKFDPSKQYYFNVKEPWGSGSIPLNLK